MKVNKILEATADSPSVEFDSEKSVMVIRGKSLMEDAYAFYNPILIWINRHIQIKQAPLVLITHFDYLNSGTTRFFMEILFTLDQSNLTHTVIWRYENGDDVIEEKGEQFNAVSNLNFVLVEAELT